MSPESRFFYDQFLVNILTEFAEPDFHCSQGVGFDGVAGVGVSV